MAKETFKAVDLMASLGGDRDLARKFEASNQIAVAVEDITLDREALCELCEIEKDTMSQIVDGSVRSVDLDTIERVLAVCEDRVRQEKHFLAYVISEAVMASDHLCADDVARAIGIAPEVLTLIFDDTLSFDMQTLNQTLAAIQAVGNKTFH